MAVKTSELLTELIGLTDSLPELTDKGFSVYNLEDAATAIRMRSATLPIACFGYEGTFPKDESRGSSICENSVVICESRFSLVLAVEYSGVEAAVDSKSVATDLLDAVRSVVLGYTGVSNRPWRFLSESPIDGEVEGVIYYGQLWSTVVSTASVN